MAEETAFGRWYERNGGKLNEKRKNRYDSDPEYRARQIENARKNRANRASKVKEASAPVYKLIGGEKVVVYRIGDLAERAGVTPQTIRKYESTGVIPEPTVGSSHRYYTANQVNLVCSMVQALAGLPLHSKERAEVMAAKVNEIHNKWEIL